jgi:hypothetical protein
MRIAIQQYNGTDNLTSHVWVPLVDPKIEDCHSRPGALAGRPCFLYSVGAEPKLAITDRVGERNGGGQRKHDQGNPSDGEESISREGSPSTQLLSTASLTNRAQANSGLRFRAHVFLDCRPQLDHGCIYHAHKR